ncbi:hypothetical protein [Pseudomonas brassicacearum]
MTVPSPCICRGCGTGCGIRIPTENAAGVATFGWPPGAISVYGRPCTLG